MLYKVVYTFYIRMDTLTIQSNLLEEDDILPAPLISANSRATSARPTCVFSTIVSEKCFKWFDNRFAIGLGDNYFLS